MARSMMKEKHIPNEYWGDTVTSLVYILNKSPTKSMKDRVPKQYRSSKCSNISHSIIFGCVYYAHVPEEMRIKSDNRSQKCIFAGYSEESKAYRLYNPITKRCVINRGVVIKEEEEWDCSIDKLVE